MISEYEYFEFLTLQEVKDHSSGQSPRKRDILIFSMYVFMLKFPKNEKGYLFLFSLQWGCVKYL